MRRPLTDQAPGCKCLRTRLGRQLALAGEDRVEAPARPRRARRPRCRARPTRSSGAAGTGPTQPLVERAAGRPEHQVAQRHEVAAEHDHRRVEHAGVSIARPRPTSLAEPPPAPRAPGVGARPAGHRLGRCAAGVSSSGMPDRAEHRVQPDRGLPAARSGRSRRGPSGRRPACARPRRRTPGRRAPACRPRRCRRRCRRCRSGRAAWSCRSAAPWCASAYAAQSASLLTCTGQPCHPGRARPGRRARLPSRSRLGAQATVRSSARTRPGTATAAPTSVAVGVLAARGARSRWPARPGQRSGPARADRPGLVRDHAAGEVEDHRRDVVDVELEAEGDVPVTDAGRPAGPGGRARPPRLASSTTRAVGLQVGHDGADRGLGQAGAAGPARPGWPARRCAGRAAPRRCCGAAPTRCWRRRRRPTTRQPRTP